MCTVTFIPQGKDRFTLTSNRDEAPSRSGKELIQRKIGNKQIRFPKDQKAGGTWIAISDANQVVCLLNGAFKKHDHKPPYKKSRGIMVLEYFSFPNAAAFINTYDFQGMEPFTMIIYDNQELWECRWDEKKVHQKRLEVTQPHIWSSSTLYTDEVKGKRKGWFKQWLNKHQAYELDEIMDFHQHAGDGDPYNDVIMNRDEIVRTVSITNIIKAPDQIELRYLDLLQEQQTNIELELDRAMVESN